MSAAAPVKPVRRIDSNSTVYSEHSDITTESNCSSRLPSPRQTCDREQCNVIVKATFLDVDEGQSLLQCFAQLRGRIISDSALVMGFGGFDIEAYEPGKFSDEHAKSAESTCAGPNMPEVREEPKDTQASLQPKSQASQASQAAGKKKSQSKQTADRTTVMLRNVPNNYTREMFLTLLDDHGFAGRYDFVYLPCDFKRQAGSATICHRQSVHPESETEQGAQVFENSLAGEPGLRLREPRGRFGRRCCHSELENDLIWQVSDPAS